MQLLHVNLFPVDCATRLRIGAFAIVAAVLTLGGCASNQPIVAEDTSDSLDAVADMPPVSTGPTLGERLGRLDRLKQTAPADSLPLVEAEYQRLLAAARGSDAPPPESAIDTSGAVSDVPEHDDDAADPDGHDYREIPASGIENPAMVFDGLRTAELRTAPGYVEPEPRVVASAAPRRSVSRPSTSGATNAERAAARPRSSAAERGSNRRLVEGLAAARAGRYDEAVDKLSGVSSADRRAQGSFYYALSLERIGRLAPAADQFRRLKAGSGALAERALVAYARVIAKMGQRSQARQLLQRFVAQNPGSSQLPHARRLLQSL